MKTAVKTFFEIYKDMSAVTKYAFRYGTVLIVTLIVCAIFFYIQSLSSGLSFYEGLMFNDIMICIKECMGSVYVLPMLYETLSIIMRNR